MITGDLRRRELRQDLVGAFGERRRIGRAGAADRHRARSARATMSRGSSMIDRQRALARAAQHAGDLAGRGRRRRSAPPDRR